MVRKSISLLFLVIMFTLTPVSTSNATIHQTCDFLTLTVNPETISAPGMSTDISVSLDQTCGKATYILIVIPPDAEDVIDDIIQDLKDADLKFLTFCIQVKSILQNYQGQTTLWYRFGYLNSGETDVHNFPNDEWKKLLGDDDANTMMMGKYKVLLIGLGFNCGSQCCLCCVRLDFSCSKFFVVPESMIGTIGPIAASLISLGALKYKKRK